MTAERWLPPPPIRWLLGIYVVTAIGLSTFQPFVDLLALRAPLLAHPAAPFRLLTYGLVSNNFPNALLVGLLVAATAVALRGRLTGGRMALALGVSAVVGGVLFLVLTRFAWLAGGTLPAWGLVGAAFGAALRRPREFAGWRAAFLGAVFVLLLISLGMSVRTPIFAPILAAVAMGGLVGVGGDSP